MTKKILVNRPGGFGDVLLATAILPALKKKWTDSHLTFATNCPEILIGNPYVNEVKASDLAIAYESYDLFFDLSYEFTPHLPILESYANIARVKKEDCRMFLRCDPLPFDLPERYAVLHLGKTEWVGRDWKVDGFQEICKRLTDKQLKVFLLGSENDRKVHSGIDLRGVLTIQQMASLIRGAALFVGIDSFPMHVAQLFEVPGVAFFGCVHPHLRIVSPKMQAVTAEGVGCLGCHHRFPTPHAKTDECLRGNRVCEEKVGVEDFWHPIAKILDDSKPDIILIGHAPYSYQVVQTGLGEVNHAAKFKKHLDASDLKTSPIIDIYQLFGKRCIDKIAQLNSKLARQGFEPIDQLNIPSAKKAVKQMAALIRNSKQNVCLLALTWNWNIAALVASGIGHLAPFIAKSYLPPLGTGICKKIYGFPDLIVTECLFVNLLGILCGIPLWKMMYLPHTYPKEADELFALSDEAVWEMKCNYIHALSETSFKTGTFTKKTVVIGIVSRFIEGKHIEHAIEAVEKCVREGLDCILVLKGGYDEVFLGGAAYKRRLQKILDRVVSQPWFFWDREYTSFPEVLKIYRIFDLCMNLSAIEGASNLIVEMMALGRPCLLLEDNTNPYLFKGGAIFAKHNSATSYGRLKCRVPDSEDVYHKLKHFFTEGDARKEWILKARKSATERFNPQLTIDRMPLLLEASQISHRGDELGKSDCAVKMEQLLQQDLLRHQIPTDITIQNILESQFPLLHK